MNNELKSVLTALDWAITEMRSAGSAMRDQDIRPDIAEQGVELLLAAEVAEVWLLNVFRDEAVNEKPRH